MITRRELLKVSGLVTAGVGLNACGAGRLAQTESQAAHLGQLCYRLTDNSSTSFHSDVRGQFRTLECLTTALRTASSLDKVLGKTVTRRYWRLHQRLSTASYSAAVTEMWRMFYELTSRLHEIRNARARKARIPVYAYNGHQHAARLWIDENVRRQTRGPLLHFDTHRDMRSLPDAHRIVKAVKRLSAGGRSRRRALDQLRRLINDHATPVTAGVLGKAVTDVVWAYPRWTFTTEILRRPVFYAHLPQAEFKYGDYRLLHDRHQDPQGGLPEGIFGDWADVQALPRAQRRGLCHKRPFHLSHVRTHPIGADALRNLRRAVPRGRYILDIDMDYFLSIDHDSGFRRPTGTGKDRLDARFLYRRRLDDARVLVDTRIRELKKLLAYLRDAGRIPSVVTLADSTYMPFATTLAGRGHWEYMPFEFAGYVHWEVRRLLAEVFADHGIDAGTA